MNRFNWARAAEGAVVGAILSSLSVLEPIANGQPVNYRAVGIAFFATVIIGAVKGIGQTYQNASMVQTTITQPAGTTALTETVASPIPSKEASNG